MSVSAQLTAIVVLMWPQHESALVEVSRSITSLVILGLSALGYVQAEASLDRQRKSEVGRDSPQLLGSDSL